MSKSTRVLYRSLLALHPAPFRREFSREILRDFDAILALQGPMALFSDALLSLVRQWVHFAAAEEPPQPAKFSLLGGSYVALAQNRLTPFDLMRGFILSTTLFYCFGKAASPETVHSFVAYLHTLL